MMTLPKLLLLTFVVGGLSAPTSFINLDTMTKPLQYDGPAMRDNIADNDKKISITIPPNPIAVILDPHRRGMAAIEQVAERSYQKLLAQMPKVNYQFTSLNPRVSYPQYPVDGTQVLISGPITLPYMGDHSVQHAWHFRNQFKRMGGKSTTASGSTIKRQYSSQIDPLPVLSPEFAPGNNRPMNEILNSLKNMNQNVQLPETAIITMISEVLTSLGNMKKNEGKPSDHQMLKLLDNFKGFITPSMVQSFFAAVNQENAEGITVNPEVSGESPKSTEDHSSSTITRSTSDELTSLTNQPSEYISTTVFETTTGIPTPKSNEEEIISSTTRPELLDGSLEIDEAIALGTDSLLVPSTSKDAKKYSDTNKDDFYVIYKRPTTQDNSLRVNTNVGVTVALNGSKIKDVKITDVVQANSDCNEQSNLIKD